MDRIGALRSTLAEQLGADLIQNPELADALVRHVDDMIDSLMKEAEEDVPLDGGLGQLVGLGPDAAETLGETRMPPLLQGYDDTVTSERIIAVGDLYYIYQHEKLGVFRAILKLQELFRAGTVRLSSGAGAFGLYQYDRRQVLRYTRRDRLQAYRRVFGYTNASPPPGAQPNRDFHNYLVHFMTQVAQFYRDQRVAELFRRRQADLGYGSIAVVRRAGLDLRNNLKDASYGHVNVLRVEVLQLLDEAFQILGSADIKKLFGADNAWDVIEEVSKRHLDQPYVNASQRSRMAIAGRNVLHWLAQPYILNSARSEFETLLQQTADDAEEWLTSAEALGIASRHPRRTSRNGRPVEVRTDETEWETVYG
jgi:hypothetical protein